MTRTPRVSDNLRTVSDNLRKRLPRDLSRKALAYTGAGLAIAGVGAGIMTTGFSGSTANAAMDSVSHRAVATAARQHHGTAAPAKAGHVAAKTAATRTVAARKSPATTTTKGTATKTAKSPAKHAAKPAAKHARTWASVSKLVAERTYPKAGHGSLPAQDKLTPAGVVGPQTWLPMTQARYDNARTIVAQAIAKHMGVRSAVIAVATSMQESGLVNLNYGDRDSLGLFQQRPSCGWGTAAQIERPAYAADAFLGALHTYQASNPGWASQPLWQAAQGVQASGFPTAYAKWEAQAAHVVASATSQLVSSSHQG